LGGIFKNLASLVHEQGDTLTRIDDAIEDTALNVEGAVLFLL
jgi:hypothetical protein